MPAVHPFKPLQFQAGRGDVSTRVAPPYDVLSAAHKADLLARDPKNIVAIDLPHVPAKELGPPAAYAGAAAAYRQFLAEGTLTRRGTAALFAYRQTFAIAGRRYQRCGMACTLDTVPFGPRPGGGILPHEQTFSGPKEDRIALMRATAAQLSPIFGLHQDQRGHASRIIREVAESRPADLTADLRDGVTHELWTVEDEATIARYQATLAGEDVFIADGHHRYNTALNYLAELSAHTPLPADHPARRTMFVLVGMSDPGLYIGPTHRVLGGMKHYTIDAFTRAAHGLLRIDPIAADPSRFDDELTARAHAAGTNALGLLDFATGRCFCATPIAADPLKATHADRCDAWRHLDVAIIQHLIVEQICQPTLNDNNPVQWAFPHTIDEVIAIGKGHETGAGGGSGFAQLAVIVRPTPLDAVRDVSRANELMPQKSTFFYPKLATGLAIHPLDA